MTTKNTKKCYDCGGEGTRWVPIWDAFGERDGEYLDDCRGCGGSGVEPTQEDRDDARTIRQEYGIW